MTMQQFINSNRKDIDDGVLRAYGVTIDTDSEREDWIVNDEGLYNWAANDGVELGLSPL